MIERRIAFLSEHASPAALLGGEDAGGQNVYVDEVSRNLALLGYQVDVFTRRDREDLPEVMEWARGVRIVNLTAGPPRPILKDAIWPHMPAFCDALLDFAARDGARYDLIHGNFWMSGWAALRLKERLGIPAVQIFHAMGKTKQHYQGAADTSPAERIAIEREVIGGMDRLIAQCPTERAELVKDYGAPISKVAIIPAAVNVDRFRPVEREKARAAIGLDTEGLVVVYVGRMLPRKDVRNLIRALALLMRRSDLPLTGLLVGGETREPDPVMTPEIGELQRLAEELGILDRLTFAGMHQGDELRLYYGAGDVAVTTPWYEPFGLTPLEAMACGRPVVGSAVGGITYTIADGKTGLLVPPRDPEALADALEYLVTREDVRLRMGRAGRHRVETRFTWPLVARRTADLYETVLTEAPVAQTSVAPRRWRPNFGVGRRAYSQLPTEDWPGGRIDEPVQPDLPGLQHHHLGTDRG